ncbi:hypothetical protein LCM08_26410 [Salipiger pacificus]|nr:hypothetical protein [Alloyangia pacifica]
MKVEPASIGKAVFACAAAVALGHFLITGLESLTASLSVGVAGGFGALALDIYRTLVSDRESQGSV